MKITVNKKHLTLAYTPFVLLLLATIAIAATTTNTFHIAVTTQANPPVVYNVTPGTVTPTAGSYLAELAISFNVTDPDGVGDLDDTSAKVNVSLSGVTRTNESGNCEVVTSSFNGGTDRTYRCIIHVRYYDNASSLWQINATVSDGTAVASNYSRFATVNSLSAFSLSSSALVLSAALGTTNNELTITVNNTGNFNFTLLNITPYALNASLTDWFMLGGETTRGTANFSLNTTSSASGFGIGLVNGSGINISNNYDSGNAGRSIFISPEYAQNDPAQINSNKTLYIYVDLPNDKGLSTGITYNTSTATAWTIIGS